MRTRRALIIGMVTHSIAWLLVVRSNLICGETSCYILWLLDVPISVTYIHLNAESTSCISFFAGGLWWASIFATLSWIRKRGRS